MNREQVEQAIELMQAWLDGKVIQWHCDEDEDDEWYDCSHFSAEFLFEDLDYRIKPEPLEFWVDVDDSGHPECVMTKRPIVIRAGLRRIKVREVL